MMFLTKRWKSKDKRGSEDEDFSNQQPRGTSGSLGSGAGKGGGDGGSIRSAGGALGKMAASQEESYFHRKTMDDLDKLHSEMKESLESAGKKAEAEVEKDKKVEKKMKDLAGDLKEIIDEGKKK